MKRKLENAIEMFPKVSRSEKESIEKVNSIKNKNLHWFHSQHKNRVMATWLFLAVIPGIEFCSYLFLYTSFAGGDWIIFSMIH